MYDCKVCLEPFEPRRTDSKYCSDACRQKHYRDNPRGYKAKDIKIKTDIKFDWQLGASLAHNYNEDYDICMRGIAACKEAEVDIQYFISRYLKKDKTVPFNKAVDDAYMALLKIAKWRKAA